MGPDQAPGSSDWMVPIGILAGLLGTAAAGVGALIALLSTNSCGAFADSCDTYGQPAEEFLPAVGVMALGAAAAVVGFVLLVVGMSRAARARQSSDPRSEPGPPLLR
ncbi:MAG TPA: hypothetical protein P5193_13130 [Microthrixaceae bacterium]|jgi:hypothetical protein|nr:hypothetical protein [Microthrixaceae bacterium]RTL08129.1 MAG: hypothetical protein EKK62_09385 [Acidimicrobiia bacterium]MCB9374608.1 hypothetical protein [Microthrixaceae bacterium]MCB9402414.1 hypothetical protein [Microthrixaceae bacterium]MCO5306308.1 hypothetical protein [Microthrixaceae bacterium]